MTGADGVNTVLDLEFLHGVVQLCSTCTFTFRNITIANERRGNNSPVDFFVGQPTPGRSIVKLQGVHRLRLACASGPDSATVVDNTPRSQVLPNRTRTQIFNVSDVVWNGRVFLRTLSTQDYTGRCVKQQPDRAGSKPIFWHSRHHGSRQCPYCLSKKVDSTAA